MLSAVENLGPSGPGRVPPYPRHHPHQLPHQLSAQHHPYHPLHTILSPTSLSQLHLPPLLNAQTPLPHPMSTVANEFVRPYPKQRYEDNRGYGIPSAVTVERRLKYGDPPPPAPSTVPISSAPAHTQTGPINLAVSNGGGGAGGGGEGGGDGGGGGSKADELTTGAYSATCWSHYHQSSNPQEVGNAAPRYTGAGSTIPPPTTTSVGAYVQKFRQEERERYLHRQEQKYQQQEQQLLDFRGAQQQQQQQRQQQQTTTERNRMLCFPAMSTLDVFGGYPALNYDMYPPYSGVHGRPNYLPNQRSLEPRYTGTAASFLPPRPPPPSSDASMTVTAAAGRLPKTAAAAPIAIKPSRWLMPPSRVPSPPGGTLSTVQHTAGRELALAPPSSTSTIPPPFSNSAGAASWYRRFGSSHHHNPHQLQQHGGGAFHNRLWAPTEPLQQSQQQQQQAAAAYLAGLSTIEEDDEMSATVTEPLYHPTALVHDGQLNHIATSLQDSYMASLQQQQQRHIPPFGSCAPFSTNAAKRTSNQPNAGQVRSEFKVPIGMESTAAQKQQQQPRSSTGLVRAEPQIAIGPEPSFAIGMGDGVLGSGSSSSSSRRTQYETDTHPELPDDNAAQQPILHTTVVKPKMFLRGSMISFQNGVKKPVEEVRLEDFLRTAAVSPDVRLTEAQTRRITPRYTDGLAEGCKKILVRFTYDQQQRYGALETTVDYPFFVTTKGWASYSPDRTFTNYGLECAPIELGDVFIVLVSSHLSSDSLLQPEDELLSPDWVEPLPRLVVPSQQKKIRITNVYPEKEPERQQPDRRREEPDDGSPILIDDEPARDWMTNSSTSTNSSSSAASVPAGASSSAYGGVKRRHDGAARRGSAKRKLLEHDIVRMDVNDSFTNDYSQQQQHQHRRSTASTDSIE